LSAKWAVTTEFLVFAEPLLVKDSSTEFCFPTKHSIASLVRRAFILGGVIQSIFFFIVHARM
jgi:hypothetical protein